mmetsp:Transcript_92806/g.200621  ORF Transcript_92806/g.200621 Transcript_92806/m.200621 type:complete len:221 (+) Transcript_92806:715-1377(+)
MDGTTATGSVGLVGAGPSRSPARLTCRRVAEMASEMAATLGKPTGVACRIMRTAGGDCRGLGAPKLEALCRRPRERLWSAEVGTACAPISLSCGGSSSAWLAVEEVLGCRMWPQHGAPEPGRFRLPPPGSGADAAAPWGAASGASLSVAIVATGTCWGIVPGGGAPVPPRRRRSASRERSMTVARGAGGRSPPDSFCPLGGPPGEPPPGVETTFPSTPTR